MLDVCWIFGLIPEGTDVIIRDLETGDDIAEYNGRDSIPEYYNQFEVFGVDAEAFTVVLYIDAEASDRK